MLEVDASVASVVGVLVFCFDQGPAHERCRTQNTTLLVPVPIQLPFVRVGRILLLVLGATNLA
jgi:hypothetical protein